MLLRSREPVLVASVCTRLYLCERTRTYAYTYAYDCARSCAGVRLTSGVHKGSVDSEGHPVIATPVAILQNQPQASAAVLAGARVAGRCGRSGT